ncbi:hypothetical protein P4O66_007191, partial [Electrophorus voltai]
LGPCLYCGVSGHILCTCSVLTHRGRNKTSSKGSEETMRDSPHLWRVL